MLFFNLNFRFLYRNLKYCGYMYLQYFVCLRTKAKSILIRGIYIRIRYDAESDGFRNLILHASLLKMHIA